VCKYGGLEEKKKGPDWSSRRFVAANSFKKPMYFAKP